MTYDPGCFRCGKTGCDGDCVPMTDAPLPGGDASLLSAHDHGNCELCDEIEAQLTLARQQVTTLQQERDAFRAQLGRLHAYSSDDMNIRHQRVVLVSDLMALLEARAAAAEQQVTVLREAMVKS